MTINEIRNDKKFNFFNTGIHKSRNDLNIIIKGW